MVIGITGNFGCGKTTVAHMFYRLGTKLIDADKIAHAIIKPNTPIYRQIIACFGKRVLAGDYISRGRLAEIAFSDKKKLSKLNRITHPKIKKIIKSKIKNSSKDDILVIDAALLIESGILPWVDKLVVVKSKPKIQLLRLKKGGLAYNDIKRRLGFQSAQDEKIRLADFIIDNSARMTATERQVRDVWRKISEDITYGARRAT